MATAKPSPGPSRDRRSLLRRHPSLFGVLVIGLSVTFLLTVSLAGLDGSDLLDTSLVPAVGAVLLPLILLAIGVFVSDANTNPSLSSASRIAWTAGLIVFWVLSLPVYWWRFVR